jgi:hypothetical protein
MKPLLVHLDEPIFEVLSRVAPAAQRERAEFVRAAIRKAVRKAEEERTRLAYARQPDLEPAEDWSNAEPWKS